jgi:cbb3-type cytochrome oxidase subunit 3
VDAAGIRDLAIALVSLFIVIGLIKMRSWGRILAIIASAALAAWWGGLYILSLAIGIVPILPGGFWNSAQAFATIAFEISVVWYLFRFKTREMFRAAQNPPIVAEDEIEQ